MPGLLLPPPCGFTSFTGPANDAIGSVISELRTRAKMKRAWCGRDGCMAGLLLYHGMSNGRPGGHTGAAIEPAGGGGCTASQAGRLKLGPCLTLNKRNHRSI